jgi:hypothetical protein
MARPFPRVLWYFTIWFMKMQQLFEKKFVKKAEIFPTCFVEKFRHKMLCFFVKNGGLCGLSKQKILADKGCIRACRHIAKKGTICRLKVCANRLLFRRDGVPPPAHK